MYFLPILKILLFINLTMEFRFPFKNMSYNDLVNFFSKEKIWDYIIMKENVDPNKYDNLGAYVSMFNDSLPNFQNEILQIIETTNQESIDAYFNELIDELNYLYALINFENLKENVDVWNEEELKLFEQQVEKDTNDYFNSPDRSKKHLEEYDAFDFTFGSYLKGELFSNQNIIKTKKVNYNFFCIEKKPKWIEMKYVISYAKFLEELLLNFTNVCRENVIKFSKNELKARFEYDEFLKPVLFLEGEQDIRYIKKAAELLNYNHLIEKIDIRQRGGYKNLDKLWDILKDSSFDTIPQKRILLYDCDTKKINETLGISYKRVLPYFSNNPVSKGIENLFSENTITQLKNNFGDFFDTTEVIRTSRGVKNVTYMIEVNSQEKTKLCDWLCENGVKEDFVNFEVVFEILNNILFPD
jgi:hypothetical protein